MSSKKTIRKDSSNTPASRPKGCTQRNLLPQGDSIDMEVNCVRCGTRLHVDDVFIDEVFASLDRAGAVMLICTCGQAQIVRNKYYSHCDD